MASKTELRQQMRRVREAMTEAERAERSIALLNNVTQLPCIQEAKLVFCHVSFKTEIDTHTIIHHLLAAGKQVAVPIVAGHGIMHAHRLRSFEDLAPGAFGILSPRTPDPIEDDPDVTCCPGLAFTEDGQRLGMGGGYYDRYLEHHHNTIAVGLCYEQQIIDHIPAEAFDQSMRHIVTDQRIITCTNRDHG